MLEPFDFDGIDVAAPTREFEGEMSLDAGGRKLRLIEVGPAHTPGDLFIHVPDAGVVYTGDILFVGATPVMWAGPVVNWIVAIDRLLDLDADTYVPGHGPVCGREEAEAVKRYWVWLEAAARHRFGLGMSAWEAARDIALSPEFKTYEWSSGGSRSGSSSTCTRSSASGVDSSAARLPPRELVTLFSRVALLAEELDGRSSLSATGPAYRSRNRDDLHGVAGSSRLPVRRSGSARRQLRLPTAACAVALGSPRRRGRPYRAVWIPVPSSRPTDPSAGPGTAPPRPRQANKWDWA